MDKIFYNKLLIGIRLKKLPKGSTPTTPADAPLQLVTIKQPKGKYLEAHLHKDVKHKTGSAETCFVVRKGKIKLDLYGPDKKFIKSILLKEGGVFITMNGSGHGIYTLEDSEILEIKNGPFIEDKILI